MIVLNGVVVDFTEFPNNENMLSKKNIKVRALNRIRWHYQGDEEFFQLALLKKELDDHMTASQIEIFYMPHSRMDRVNDSYTMALSVSANMINAMNFVSVVVTEAHSDVTLAVLDRSYNDPWCLNAANELINGYGFDSVFYPDAGAAKRYDLDFPYGIGNKVRDFKSGNITSYSIAGTVGENVLIIDDLCSRGGTFIEAAVQLKERGAKKVSLLVAHCEQNVFTGTLFHYIDKLYCGDFNILDREHKQVILL